MKTFLAAASATVVSIFFFVFVASAEPPPVPLGTATSFAVLAGSTITNTGTTTIHGNVGLHPGTAYDDTGVTVNGSEHIADEVAANAKQDLVTAYNDAAGRTPVTRIATELGNQILKAGVYDSESGTFQLTGTLTLDAEGDPNAVWIFLTSSTLNTASSAVVSLINGAQACNVFWKVGSSATLGTSTRFVGTIMALTSIGLNTNATLEGRALARNGAVTMDSNVITRSSCASPAASPSPTPTNGDGGGTTPPPSPNGGSPTPPVVGPGPGAGDGAGVVAGGPARAGAGRAGSAGAGTGAGARAGRGSGRGARIPFTGVVLPAESLILGSALVLGGMIYVFLANPSTRLALAMASYRPRRRTGRINRRSLMRAVVRKIPESVRESFRI